MTAFNNRARIAPKRNLDRGDASTLWSRNPIPNFTLFNGRHGWHDLDNGQLRFTYPNGSLTRDQIDQMQRNLDGEQTRFQDRK